RFTICPSSVTSFTPRETRRRTSPAISSIVRLRSAPRVCGTMQKVQRMLQPCMIETKAVACFGASCWSQMVDCEPGSSAISTIERRRSSIARRRDDTLAARALPGEQFLHVIGYTMKFLRAGDEIHVRQVLEQGFAAGLGHAAEKPEHHVRTFPGHAAEHSHF